MSEAESHEGGPWAATRGRRGTSERSVRVKRSFKKGVALLFSFLLLLSIGRRKCLRV